MRLTLRQLKRIISEALVEGDAADATVYKVLPPTETSPSVGNQILNLYYQYIDDKDGRPRVRSDIMKGFAAVLMSANPESADRAISYACGSFVYGGFEYTERVRNADATYENFASPAAGDLNSLQASRAPKPRRRGRYER